VSKTALPAPLDDPRMWRLALAELHPDRGGSHELFVWGQGVREAVENGAATSNGGRCSECRGPARQVRQDRPGQDDPTPRVPYPQRVDHTELWLRAIRYGHELVGPVGDLLLELRDHEQATSGWQQLAEQRGATYRQLKYLAVLADIPAREVYEIGERIPLSQAMAHHIISRLKGRAA
jgi:hypothetical protein